MFTIIMCTYNGERTIKKAIDSILNQYEYEKYVEKFIVVDNSSIDGTSEIVKSYSDRILYSYEKRSGLGWARQNGVGFVKSEWTIFIDDDNELDKNWVVCAAQYISENTNIDLFGGTIIPKLDFIPLDDERDNLKKHLSMVACNTYRRDEIDYTLKQSPVGCIFGAGMIIKSQYLIKLNDTGWLKQIGRTKDNTMAGDDGEIVQFVKKNGGRIGYCPYMIIEHNIPSFRLQEEYLLKLGASLAQGVYNCQSMAPLYILRRIKTITQYLGKHNPYQRDTLDFKLWEQSRKIYFKMLFKDKIFLKRVC